MLLLTTILTGVKEKPQGYEKHQCTTGRTGAMQLQEKPP